ncbi:MAG: DUF3570 domain-containing protein [Pseudomonadota bacterium]
MSPQHPVPSGDFDRPLEATASAGLDAAHGSVRPVFGSLVMAALALPGVMLASPAQAQTAPEYGTIGFKYLHYQDEQPGLKRIKVSSPSVYVLAPLGKQWSIEGSGVVDDVSGASPRWHSSVSGASRMEDYRKAGDVKVTHYTGHASYSLGAAFSDEDDYRSKAVSAGASLFSADRNTTYNIGLGLARDRIDATDGGFLGTALNKKKNTHELLLGVTQALSRVDLAQFNVTYSNGKGFYSDPYKAFDERPGRREQVALLGRWNHHFEGDGSTLRTSYRFYHDSFKINAHTLGLEWAKPVAGGLTLSPLLRYYSQSAAYFYGDALANPATLPVPAGYVLGNPPLYSADHRLAAFGALTYGLKAEYKVGADWKIDAKVEQYEQRSNWRMSGSGSPGLADFSATMVQLGVSRRF